MRKSLLLLLVSASFCLAQSPYPDPHLGVRPGAFSARSLSLGHTAIVGETGPASMLNNPATLAEQESLWRFDVTADVFRVREIRKYPFYNSFDARIDYNNYAINDHLYSQLEGGLAYRVPVNGVRSLVLSAASYVPYRFDYTYHEEVRNRGASGGVLDQPLGQNRLDVDGALRSLTFGAAAASGRIALGFAVSTLLGSWDYERGVFYANEFAAEDAGLDSLTYVDRAEYSPAGTLAEMTAGLTWTVDERLTLGARVLLPGGDFKFDRVVSEDSYAVTIDSVSFGDATVAVTYPPRLGGGVQFRPRGEFRPVLLLEGDWIGYRDVSDAYDNTFEIRAGAEQQIVPGAPVRLGFVYGTSPQDRDRAMSLFTAGIGFTLQKLRGDFGLEIGKVNYLHPDLFPQTLYGGTNRADHDRVETALFRGMISLRYEL